MFTLGLVAILSSSLAHQGSVASASGIGIRKEGPLTAGLGDIIEYAITIYNLGDFDISNMTITDVFPNGTSVNWTVNYLAPQGHSGDSFKISGIGYTVDFKDVFPSDIDGPHVINHAKVIGYVFIGGLTLTVSAETEFPTFVYTGPVGGFTVRVKSTFSPKPTTIYFVLIFVITAAIGVFKHKATSSLDGFKRSERRGAGKKRKSVL